MDKKNVGRLLCVIFYYCWSICCFGNVGDSVMFKTAYENEHGKSVYKFLRNEDKLFAIGNYTQLFDLSNNDLTLEKEINNQGVGRDGYVKDDNLYVVVRGNGSGNKYTKSPNIVLDFEDNISNFDQDKGSFDSYSHEGDSYINETGIPCPNLGFHSAKCFSKDNHPAIIKKAISNIDNNREAFVSLWVNFEELSSSNKTKIPILANDDFLVVSIIAYKDNDVVKLGLIIGDEVEWIADSNIKMNEWYNLKIHIDAKEVELCYRSKECGSFLRLLKESHGFVSA